MQKYRESFAVSEHRQTPPAIARLALQTDWTMGLSDENVDISTARRIIGTLRSTVMEGSFGNQKQHYNVGRIAARNSRSETLLLFFGIQCTNAAILAARQLAIEEKRKQRRKRRA